MKKLLLIILVAFGILLAGCGDSAHKEDSHKDHDDGDHDHTHEEETSSASEETPEESVIGDIDSGVEDEDEDVEIGDLI